MHSNALASAALALLVAVPAQDPAAADDHRILLQLAQFDPLRGEPAVPAMLRADRDIDLWIVQFRSRPDDALRGAVTAAGGEIHGYLPHDAYVVRMPIGTAAAVARQPGVRWVGWYHPAYRLEPALLAEQVAGIRAPVRRYNLVVVDKHRDKPALLARIRALGGVVEHEQPGSLLFEVSLDSVQLLQVARLDEVLWIDLWTPIELDMDNARIQGGGNYVEAQGGYTGAGVVGHVYEGVEPTHTDFAGRVPSAVLSCATAASHGHCTAGIVYGAGNSHPSARGMAPAATFFYTNQSCVNAGVSRWQVVEELVTNRQVSLTTASWGGTRTRAYTSTSASTDDIIFDHDIVWTQSQSNAGNQDSRPEAWAKNIVSIGGVQHFNNSDPGDDSWDAGAGSTGPAADGRIKPDLCAYYDAIWTSDLTGTAGYSTTNHYTGFGGTSGATPIVSGHNVLAIQMFTDALFGNELRNPGGSRFSNRPHAATLKALMIASARQYPFTSGSTDNRREHQGWGFPDLRATYDARAKMVLVDETDVLVQGQFKRYCVQVAAGETELKIAMCFSDPAGNPAATLARINDLTLRVASPSGTLYWGNQGLTAGNWSTAGGAADTRDTVECVFVQNPPAGEWKVDVIATLIAEDSHVETPAVDADFGLAIKGATDATAGAFATFGTGCAGTAGVPALSGGGDPNIRGTFDVDLANAPAGASVAMFLGVSNQVWAGGSLPFDLGVINAPGCSLLVSTENVLPAAADGSGNATKAIAIPDRPDFVCARVHVQYVVLDVGANLLGITTSNAGTLKIGDQ
jgi:hypothetical protein